MPNIVHTSKNAAHRKVNVHKKRKQLRKEWDEEWGDLYTEGNIWWLGSPRANWEYRMGKNPWGWFREYLIVSLCRTSTPA